MVTLDSISSVHYIRMKGLKKGKQAFRRKGWGGFHGIRNRPSAKHDSFVRDQISIIFVRFIIPDIIFAFWTCFAPPANMTLTAGSEEDKLKETITLVFV